MQLQVSTKRLAILTGLSLLLMTVIAGFTVGGVFNSLFTEDFKLFKQNFKVIKPYYFLGVLGWCVIFVLDVIVSWSLYQFYKKKHTVKSSVMGISRFLYSVILAVAILKLLGVFNITNTNYQKAFNLINSFYEIWHFGLIIFGFHLMVLASLVCNKSKVNYVLSFLLLTAGIGYIFSIVWELFIPGYEFYKANIEAIFIIPMIFGEFGLAIWMLTKGRKETTSL